MSFSTETTEIGYLADAVETTFEIPFVYSHRDYIKVEIYQDILNTETEEMETVTTPLVVNEDFRFVDDDTIETIELVDDGLGNLIPTALALPVGVTLRIYRDTEDTHEVVYNTYQFPYSTVNKDFDQVYQRLQELRREVDRAIKLNYLSLEDGEALTGEDIIEAITALEDLIETMSTGAGLPTGGVDGDFLERRVDEITEAATGQWVSGSFSGFSARFNENFESDGLQDTLLKILNFAYTAPLISLSTSPSNSVREKGTVVASVTLNATTTRRSNDITEVRFYRAGGLIHTVNPATAGGGSESYISAVPFSDTISFYAQVTDNTSTVTSNTVTHTFVYPYYHGVGAAGLDASGIVSNLTKDVRTSTPSLAVTTSPTNQHFYFCYPKAYPALNSILDTNEFETLSGYTYREVSITGLDGTSQSYRVYELTLPTTQVNFTNTFKR